MKTILLFLILSISGLTYSQQSNTPKKLSDISKLNTDKKGGYTQLNDQVFVSYSYIRNLGKFGDIYESSNGITLNYGKYFPNNWLVVLRTGYVSEKLREGIDSGGYSNFNVYPLHIGGRYYVYKNTIMPYFSFMNGLNFISTSNYLGDPEIEDQFLLRYAFQVGFGIDVKFTKNMGMNLNINFNNSFYKDDDIFDQTNSQMMTGFEYNFGFMYDFK
ncbi:MAG TPA: hypothetical protein PLD63_01780 [Ignavibacteria bacterium]|nr:hypothetical protein [Ignavibacteria bacterium]